MPEKFKWLKREGQLAECLVTPERNREFERVIKAMLDVGKPLAEIIDGFEREGNITPQEWLSIGFALGYYNGRMEV